MAAYEVLGTPFVVIGARNRWSVFRKPITDKATRVAGPMTTRKAALEWVADNKD